MWQEIRMAQGTIHSQFAAGNLTETENIFRTKILHIHVKNNELNYQQTCFANFSSQNEIGEISLLELWMDGDIESTQTSGIHWCTVTLSFRRFKSHEGVIVALSYRYVKNHSREICKGGLCCGKPITQKNVSWSCSKTKIINFFQNRKLKEKYVPRTVKARLMTTVKNSDGIQFRLQCSVATIIYSSYETL